MWLAWSSHSTCYLFDLFHLVQAASQQCSGLEGATVREPSRLAGTSLSQCRVGSYQRDRIGWTVCSENYSGDMETLEPGNHGVEFLEMRSHVFGRGAFIDGSNQANLA